MNATSNESGASSALGTTVSEQDAPAILSSGDAVAPESATWAIEPTVATDALGRPLNYYITRGPQGPTLLGSWPDATADEIVLAHAAPDLLAALKGLLGMAECWETAAGRKNIQLENSDAVKAARAAITKAGA